MEGPRERILRLLSSNEMVGLLGASRTTRKLAKEHILSRVETGRWGILQLFSDSGDLYPAYQRTDGRLSSEIRIHSHPFDENKPKEALRAGQFLAHMAVAILNECDRACFQRWGKTLRPWAYGVVVVTTLVMHSGKVSLVVALNGGASECRGIYAQFCMSQRFASILLSLGIGNVHVVHNSSPPHGGLLKIFENRVFGPDRGQRFKEWYRVAARSEGQDWHGEQKILQYIGDTFGFDMKKFVLCLGISHLAGPCGDGTNGAQYCGDFLEVLRTLDHGFLGHGSGHVMGFWLAAKAANRKDDPIFRISLDHFKK